jgi:hypothetical protein
MRKASFTDERISFALRQVLGGYARPIFINSSSNMSLSFEDRWSAKWSTPH